jgi:G3E family GTPase
MAEPINLCLGYEQRMLEALTRPFILPVTLITGFLGSGKTTLLRSLLTQKRNLRIATLVNDLGEFNHDVQLLELVTTAASSSSSSSASSSHHPPSHQPASDRVMDLHGNCLCCSHLQQEMRQNVWECLQTPDGEARAVDYLVIETSGVTDPETLIRALDEKFGKMTRARLDSVVTVVDADVLYAELIPSIDPAATAAAAASSVAGVTGAPAPLPPPMSTARRHQLECADVILLNKIDLLQDPNQLDAVESHLRALNPLARIHRTRYTEVPLPCVLDVELPDVGMGQMTHETGAANYTTRNASTLRSQASHNVTNRGKANNLLTGATTAAAAASSDTGAAATHLVTDGLSAFTFESTRPFLLHKLQRFFSYLFPAEAVVRCKGFLQVRDLPGRRVSLSMSGRRRFHLSDEGPWQSAPKTQLVFIGREPIFDKAAIAAALEEACNEEGGGKEAASSQLAAKIRALVAQDKRMEVVEPRTLLAPLLFPRQKTGAEKSEEQFPEWVDRLVTFRLTGAPSLGVTSEHLRMTHGLDLNALNRALQEKVNMAGDPGTPLLHTLPFGGEEGALALCFVVEDGEEAEGRGEAYFTKTWAWMVEAAANSVIARHLGHLQLCKCGH